MRNILIGIAVVVVVLALVLVGGLALTRFGAFGALGYGRFGYPLYGFGIIGLVGLLSRVLFWGLIFAAVIWLVMALTRGGTPVQVAGPGQIAAAAPLSPLDVLKMRYAKGEITKEQFDEMKSTLGV